MKQKFGWNLKPLLAVSMVLVLSMGLFGCDLFTVEEEDTTVKTALADVQADPVAYYNRVIPELARAIGFEMETGYKMNDIEADNDLLKAARNTLKNYATGYLNHKFDYSLTAQEEALEKGDLLDGVDVSEKCPELYFALAQTDVLSFEAVEAMDVKIAEKLEALEEAIAQGKNPAMADASDAEKREYVVEALSEGDARLARSMYQINAELNPETALRLLNSIPKEDIMAQLAKAETYLLAEDYTLVPKEFTMTAKVLKNKDRVNELTYTMKADVVVTGQGTGAFADEGAFTVELELEKTVIYKNIMWEVRI